jgi:8-amino-3,8-dideoxy-alpha-D-manno-octulosonate transaminase
MPGFEFFGDEERKEVQDVLDTGVLFRYGFDGARKGHWKAKTFESELQTRIGTKHCHLCSSGTAALSIALAACGIGAGDEVIVPPFTFLATIESILNAGAVPIFSEIDETLCLDPSALATVITGRTKAVVPVHMCGSMAAIDKIASVCDEKDLILVEDACQSFGGRFQGKYLGTFGKAGCFSFDAVKTITCGEGGAVITDDSDVYGLAHEYSDHGHDHIGSDRGLEGHPILGANYRVSELNAAVGLAQLRKTESIIAKQRANKSFLKNALDGIPGVEFRKIPDENGDSSTFLSLFLTDEEKTRKTAAAMAEAGVDGCFYWYDNNWHYLRQWEHLKNLKTSAKLPLSLLDKCPDYNKTELPASDKIMGRTLSMQIKLSWSTSELEERARRMVAVLRQ